MSSASGGDYSGSGTVSGTVTLYEIPDSTADVTLYSTCGRMQTITVTRGTGNVGTATYEWTAVPTYDPSYNTAYYLISAKCDGYKTRTYTGVTPGTSKNLYLTPLRKITLETQGGVYSIDPCTSSSLNIIATVRDDNHDPIVYNAQNPPPGSTVRFVTNVASFNETTLQQTSYAHTDANGQATVTLYGMRWAGTATVVATDDVAANGDLMTPNYPDTTDDTYRCDWEPVHDSSGQPRTISIQAPYVGVDASAQPEYIARCGSSYSTVTAHVTLCSGNAPTGTTVSFTIGQNAPCVFVDTGTKSTSANTNSSGDASVQVRADDDHHIGTATVTASASVYAGSGQGVTYVTVAEYATKVAVSANPTELTQPGTSDILFTATDPSGNPVENVQLSLRTTAGYLSDITPSNQMTDSNGQVSATLHLSSRPSAYVSTGYTDDCLGTLNVGTVVVYREPRWNNISVGVNFSSPLVDDLIPGDGKEVAVIAQTSLDSNQQRQPDGRMYIWNSDGTLAWTSKDVGGNDLTIDTNGDNTLSAGDVAGIGKIITAPGGVLTGLPSDLKEVIAFGYDTAFKRLAGWPTTTEFAFAKAAAAIGDVNLDGSKEVVAADFSCFVFSWNPTGKWNTSSAPFLWRQVTGSADTSIVNSSVALGDVNHFADTSRMPDAVVGSWYSPHELFAFPGDEWGDHPEGSPSYPVQWDPRDTTGHTDSSPAIGLIDGDNENDVAICDDSGRLHMWLSSTDTWISYQLAADTDSDKKIKSSPSIVALDSQRCVVVGCNNGRVYAVKSDGTPITGWPAAGIPLDSNPRYTYNQVQSSPVVGDVMNTSTQEVPDQQIVVGTTQGDVYVLWKDGNNHANGPVAKVWTCSQGTYVAVNAAPAICSLNGSTLSLIVGSNDGIYKMDLYSSTLDPYDPNNAARFPWPTFHHDSARTGCTTTPASPVSASISGKVTLSGSPVPGAHIRIRTTGGQQVAVYGRSGATRTDPVLAVGNQTANDEINEGGYCINQLPPNTTYQITATDASENHSVTLSNVSVTTGRLSLDIALTP